MVRIRLGYREDRGRIGWVDVITALPFYLTMGVGLGILMGALLP